MTFVARVRLVSKKSEITSVQVEGSECIVHYLDDEAPAYAVCAALRHVMGRVARGELPAHDGFTVRIAFVRSGAR